MPKKYARQALLVLGVPAFAWIVLTLVLIHQNADWMSAIRKASPNLPESELSHRSLDALCHPPTTGGDDLCGTRRRVESLRTLAAATIGATAILLILVHLLGKRCRRDRQLLLRWFRTGTYGMIGATLLLVLSQALLLSAALLYGLEEFLRVVPGGLIVMIALGALVAVYSIARLLFSFGREIPMEVDGRLVSASQAPELWQFVEKAAAAVGTSPPQNIFVGTRPTFFVTETSVATSSGKISGRTLYVSLPLCRMLTRPEFRSIVGHEMAHFHGSDTAFSQQFYPLFRHASDTLQSVAGTAQSVGAGGFALLPAISLLSFFLNSFSEAEAEISRERELVADAVGASITTPADMARALTKIIRYDSVWESAYTELLDGPRSTTETPLLSDLFARAAEKEDQRRSRAEQIADLEGEKLAHPTDSHPPLGVRLRALGSSVEEMFDGSQEIRPPDAASLLVPDQDTVERNLVPAFAPKSEEAERIFCRRQPGFAAMEYYGLILNRSFLVYVSEKGLYGLKFDDMADSKQPEFFKPALEELDNPWFTPGTEAFDKAMMQSKRNFFIDRSQIEAVTFDPSSKWGMGKIPHVGRLRLRLKTGKKRDLILLGHAYGDGISRYIRERYGISG